MKKKRFKKKYKQMELKYFLIRQINLEIQSKMKIEIYKIWKIWKMEYKNKLAKNLKKINKILNKYIFRHRVEEKEDLKICVFLNQQLQKKRY